MAAKVAFFNLGKLATSPWCRFYLIPYTGSLGDAQ